LIGAQAAMPGRQVVTLSGDGGIAMLQGDLLTLRQLNLPVKVVVFNNGSLGFVELEMKAAGWPSYGTDLVSPNFAALAESADIRGIRVEAPEDLRPALQTALDHDGPCLVDVKVNRQELAMRPTITVSSATVKRSLSMKFGSSGKCANPKRTGELHSTLVKQEKEMIEAAFAASQGRIFGPTGASTKLGLLSRTLDSKIRRLKINVYRFKTPR
jgi:hypothetical protein